MAAYERFEDERCIRMSIHHLWIKVKMGQIPNIAQAYIQSGDHSVLEAQTSHLTHPIRAPVP